MTPDQIATIRSTWNLMGATTDAVAPLFYDRLFQRDPSVRSLFRQTDMPAQGEKLMQTLAVVVRSLDHLETLLPAVQALGRRHAGYGVQDAHYDLVGAALLDTFADILGDAFTSDARAAWAAAYGTLASVMQQAAAEPVASVSTAIGTAIGNVG